jgi:hypothetical protein
MWSSSASAFASALGCPSSLARDAAIVTEDELGLGAPGALAAAGAGFFFSSLVAPWNPPPSSSPSSLSACDSHQGSASLHRAGTQAHRALG